MSADSPTGSTGQQWRKKPVVVEAVQWTGKPGNIAEVTRFMGVCAFNHGDPAIYTLEGEMRVSKGDWIIKGIKGEFYPCKPDIFAATYEPAQQQPPATTQANRWMGCPFCAQYAAKLQELGIADPTQQPK